MAEQPNVFQDLIPPQPPEPLRFLDLVPGALLILAMAFLAFLAIRYRRQIAAAMRALMHSWIVYPLVGLVIFGFARELGHFYNTRDSIASALVFVVCMAVTSIPMAAKLFKRP